MSKPFNIHDWQAKQRRLTEQEQLGLELTDEEKDYVDDMMAVIKRKIVNSVSPDYKVEKTTALFKYIDGWFEVQGGTYEENVKEMSATGTGASVGAGGGEAFATPNAFKKKRK